MDYKPLILDPPGLEALVSDEYLSFVRRTALEAGLLMLLERHRAHPDYPFPDTKFNPNTGENLPEESYSVRYCWFLGRGAEACAAHIRILDALDGIAPQRNEIRALLQGFVEAQTDAILEVLDRNSGRCPFRLNSSLKAIDADGNPVEVDTSGKGAGDLFCAKGLIASGVPEKAAQGKAIFDDYIECVKAQSYLSDQSPGESDKVSHGAVMLAFGTMPLLFEHSSGSERDRWARLLAELIDYVLDRHWDEKTGRFSEYVMKAGGERTPLIDPGHATELVGLGLQAVQSAQDSGAHMDGAAEAAFSRAEQSLPKILFHAFDIGHNAEHGGIYKAVNNATGKPVNDDLPWWNLPETMRAAVRSGAVLDADAALKARRIACVCSNDYFAHYPNPDNMLFPFQTRSGSTGKVINVAPAVPEGDPLYHTNLALIDMLSSLESLKG